MSATSNAALPYHEPGIITILVQGSLLLLLNAVNHALDRLISCGLVGQICVGIAWGKPGATWLNEDTEEVIVQLRYLGLLLLVYEGGLSTNFATLRANIALSLGAALTGIGTPIALSYVLVGLLGASPLQAFAAGAALCSTSLGTTFTVLKTTGLAETRLGVVLSSAAIMDDVVGLVMVQVIQTLGENASSFSPVTVIRPVFVALAFATFIPLGAWLIVKPLTLNLNALRDRDRNGLFHTILTHPWTSLTSHTLILVAMIAGASFAGTSNLLAAYIAGATISWWDTAVPHLQPRQVVSRSGSPMATEKRISGEQTFKKNTTNQPYGEFWLRYFLPQSDFQSLFRKCSAAE